MLDALLRIAEVLTHLVGGYALHKARAAKFRQVVLGRNWATPMPGGIPKHRATEWCCYRRPYVCSQQSLALSPKRKPVCFLYLSHAGRIISPTATMRTSSFVMLDAGSARCGSLAWRVADRVCYFCRLVHRACAAFLAFSLRCSSVSLSADALPPLRPSATAAGFFFLAMSRALQQCRLANQMAKKCQYIGQ
jgi:hypothetical protein